MEKAWSISDGHLYYVCDKEMRRRDGMGRNCI